MVNSAIQQARQYVQFALNAEDEPAGSQTSVEPILLSSEGSNDAYNGSQLQVNPETGEIRGDEEAEVAF
jgi:hypothetical protein